MNQVKEEQEGILAIHWKFIYLFPDTKTLKKFLNFGQLSKETQIYFTAQKIS